MAKGYPDFFGFSIFSQYGSFQMGEYLLAASLANSTTTIFNLEGKGKVYSARLHSNIAVDPSNLAVQVIVDGITTGAHGIKTLLKYGIRGSLDMPFVVTEYDEAFPQFTLVIQQDISFVSSFVVQFVLGALGGASFWGECHWAKVI